MLLSDVLTALQTYIMHVGDQDKMYICKYGTTTEVFEFDAFCLMYSFVYIANNSTPNSFIMYKISGTP